MKNQSPPLPQYPSPTDKSSVAAQFGLTNTNTHGHSGAGMDGGQIDYKNLLNKPTIPTVYRGIINSTVANSILPTGWSASKLGTGDYVITHNLGIANYSVVAIAYTYVVSLGTVDANTFEVLVVNLSGVAKDTNVNFILAPL